MVSVECLFEEIKGLNPDLALSLKWINSQSPVLEVKAKSGSLKLPEECHIDQKTGNIMAEHEGFTECIYVDYTSKVDKKFSLFRRKKFA